MSDTLRTDLAEIEGCPFGVDADFSRYLERELVAARAELVETKKELNDKSKFCYAVEQALDGLKGDYVEIIKELRKDAEKYRWLRDNTCKSSLYEHCGIEGYDTEVMISGEVLDAAIDAAMKEGGK